MSELLKNKLFYPAGTFLRPACGGKQSTFSIYPVRMPDGTDRYKLNIEILLEKSTSDNIKNFHQLGGDDDTIKKIPGLVFVEKYTPAGAIPTAHNGTDLEEGDVVLTFDANEKVSVSMSFDVKGGGKTQSAF